MNQELFIKSYLEKIDQRFGFGGNLGFAFEIFSIAAILDKPFDEIYNDISTLVKSEDGAHTGQHDGGVDGIYFDENTATLTIFQTKVSQHLGDNEVTKFVSDYQNLFERMNAMQLPLNKNINAKLQAVWDIPKQGITYSPRLFFIFNGKKEGQDKAIAERHMQAYPILEIWDAEDLYSKIEQLQSAQRKRKSVPFTFMAEKSNISLANDPQALTTYAKGNVRAVGFRLKATELCRLIEEEKKINGHDDHLYGQNIRGLLGAIKTNPQIKATLMGDTAAYFPFLNNGITMIAETVKLPNAMQASLYPIQTVNPVIVNGLQSTQVIYEVYRQHPEKLVDVDVMVRLYDTQDEELAEKITTATNTQTSIGVRDKMSNRGFNQHLKALFENKGIGYIAKRGDSFENRLSRDLHETVTSEILLKFWFATYYERPETAKSSKAEVLQQLYNATGDVDHPLHYLFGGSIDSPIYAQMLNVYAIYKVVTGKRSDATDATPDVIHFSDELLSYGIYKYLVVQNRDAITGADVSTVLDSAYTIVFQGIQTICTEQQNLLATQNRNYHHNTYFKSSQSRIDLNRTANWFESYDWHPV